MTEKGATLQSKIFEKQTGAHLPPALGYVIHVIRHSSFQVGKVARKL
uniref:Uncharacterized protein MANES_04G000200 n=1 Tax=Rhizophora mucronata TaxID=61149 RepID=A0A2P2QGI8_RHIMU